jgi:hypothetical protein
MESNTEVKTPKLNKTNISSTFFGNEGGSASSMKNIHGTVSKLAGHVRKVVIRVGALEKNISKIEEKLKKEPEDKKTKTESKNNFNSTLLETNKILVDIQKQLEQHFSNLAKEEKEKQQTLKKEKSKKRFGMEEGALESAKRIGSALVKTTSKILSPVKGFFDKILAFLGFLAAGFLTNAVFGWLSKEENRKKLQKFFNILTQNWKLFAKILATFAALKIGATLLGGLGVLKASLFLLKTLFMNPLFWKALLAVGVGILAFKAGEALYKSVRGGVTGGQSFIKAHEVLDARLADAGLGIEKPFFGSPRGYVKGTEATGFRASYDLTPEQQAIVDDVIEKREQLYNLKSQMETDMEKAASKIESQGSTGTAKEGLNQTSNLRQLERDKVRKQYNDKVLKTILPQYANIEPRAMGGPVMAGRAYLVGEKGPELFSPNIDGSIVNNMRTEKIYNMISKNPKRNRKVNIQTMDLPPITVPMGGEGSTSSPSPAPSVPTISSRNILDSMRNETPGIYGIYV